jgi:hypothetical protein
LSLAYIQPKADDARGNKTKRTKRTGWSRERNAGKENAPSALPAADSSPDDDWAEAGTVMLWKSNTCAMRKTRSQRSRLALIFLPEQGTFL